MNEKQLLELKEQIDVSKSKLSELKGRKQVLMGTLKEKWGCSTVSQAEEKMRKFKGEISDLEDRKEQGIKVLEENYEL